MNVEAKAKIREQELIWNHFGRNFNVLFIIQIFGLLSVISYGARLLISHCLFAVTGTVKLKRKIVNQIENRYNCDHSAVGD